MKILVARQPIFDQDEHVAGYELLSRSAALDENDASGAAGEDSAGRVIVDAFLGIGVDRLTEGNPAFLDVSREMLLEGTLELLDPGAIVAQLPASIEPDEDLVTAYKGLAYSGYRFAIDHFRFRPALEPLLALAEFVKVDVLEHPGDALEQQIQLLGDTHLQLLAEHVENRTVHERCRGLGFSLFQGLLFARPETVSRRDLSVEHLRTFRLMRLARDMSVTDALVEAEFQADVALSYKLLRIANSAATGAKGIRSIGHAIRLLGRAPIYRWLSLLLATPSTENRLDTEISCAMLSRARFCELLADAGTRPLAAGSLFMVGLISALETFMNIPASETTAQLELAPEVAAALNGHRGPFGTALALVEAYEDGRWDDMGTAAADLGLDAARITPVYIEAFEWARTQTEQTGEPTTEATGAAL